MSRYSIYQGSLWQLWLNNRLKVCGGVIGGSTYSSSQYLQSSEPHIRRYVGCGVKSKQRDGDEAKVDQEGENVEHKQPSEEQEVGEDAGAKPAAYLLDDALPQLQGLPGWPYTVATPAERLRGQLVTW